MTVENSAGESVQEKVSDTSIPKWFTPVSVTAIIWNVLGLMMFIVQIAMSDESMAKLPVEQQELYAVLPNWVMVAFALSVIAGVIGSILLVMKRSLAFPVFLLSLIAVIAQFSYTFFMSNTIEVMGMSSMVMPMVVIIIASTLVWLAYSAKNRSWLC